MNQALLDAYKRQNPKKYLQKFGNKTIEEILTGVKPEIKPEPKVKVEIIHREEIEPTFNKLPEFTGEIIKPKKGKKKVDNEQSS